MEHLELAEPNDEGSLTLFEVEVNAGLDNLICPKHVRSGLGRVNKGNHFRFDRLRTFD